MPITVNRLLKLIQEEVKKGNGNKQIFISRDSEGNGYHPLYYGFMTEKEMEDYVDIYKDIEGIDFKDNPEDINKIIILG